MGKDAGMVFLFTRIDHPEATHPKTGAEADHILGSQLHLIEEILSQHGVHWTKRTPTGVLAAFEALPPPGLATHRPASHSSPEGHGNPRPQGGPGEAAVALQKEFQNRVWGPMGKARIAVALHWGEAETFAGGSTFTETPRESRGRIPVQADRGPDFIHALKLLEATPPGQVLLTMPAVHFIPLAPSSRLKDMGSHFLKDLSEPQNLYSMVHPDLDPGDSQPPLSLKDYPQNFLPQTSPFFGREEEMGEVTRLLADPQVRLTTLIGPGGFGKTRLAFQSAAEVVEKFADGVFIVALAPLLSDQLLVGSIANAVRFFFHGAEDPQAQLLSHLKQKEMLLVLDNFEHIIEGAEVVAEILKQAPRVKVLATSREILRVPGEKVLEVKGLRFPAVAADEEIEAFSAVQLFLKNARLLKPQYSLQAQDRPALLSVCRHLEGMPLGLELSATWVNMLTLPQIAEKIGDSRDFLATSMPHLPARHRSLRAVFEYSWILLSERQKKVLKSVSVFKGGFGVEAAQSVAGADKDLLEALVLKSLLRRPWEGRYETHELLRYYAKEKLFDDASEKEQAFDAHCLYFSRWLSKKEKDLYGPGQRAALEELAVEIGNIREGWKRAVEGGKEKELEGYAGAFYSILETKGWLQEGRDRFQAAAEALKAGSSPGERDRKPDLQASMMARWAFFENLLGHPQKAQEIYEESLALSPYPPPLQAGFTLSGLGIVLETQGHYEKARSWYEKSFQAYQKAKDRSGMSWSLNHLGHIAERLGEQTKALSMVEKSLSYSGSDRDERAAAYSHNLMGDILHDLGRFEEARIDYQKGLSAYLEAGDRKGVAWSFANLGKEAEVLGDFAGAHQMYQESLALSREMGDRRGMAWVQNLLGWLAWAVGDYKEATEFCQEGLALYRQMGDSRGEAWTLDLLGNLKLAQREDAEAEKLYQLAYGLLSKEGMSPLSQGWYGYHLGTLWAFRQDARRAEAEFLKALGHFEKAKDKLGQAATLIQLGEGACLQKSFSSSRRYFQKALSLCLQARLSPFLADGITGVARLLKAEGDERQAISFLMVALSHPTCRRQTKDRAVAFSLDLQSHFPPQEVEGAAQWAKAARLEDVVAAWLSSKPVPSPGKKRPVKKAKSRRPAKPRKVPKKKRR